MTISPNPADNMFLITTVHDQGTVKIMNMNGQLIKTVSINSNQTEVNISNLASGMYLIMLEGERDGIVKKLVKK